MKFRVESHVEEALAELASKKRVALEEIGLLAERYAKTACPVDTGRLRNSITHEADEESVSIGTNVEYGKYVELGSSRRRPHPYLKPAATGHTGVQAVTVKPAGASAM